MYRHVRQSCKIANSEDGMEKLMEHTLQRQLAAQHQATTQLQAQMAELTSLMKTQLALRPEPPAQILQPMTNVAQVNNGPVTNVQQTVVNIHPWDGDRRITLGVNEIAAAFTENARLREYTRLGDHELTDPAIAPPYVTELLVDLVKRAHTDPATRNVYLSPKRADQVLVHLKSGGWEVLPLFEATRLLFDGVAATIHRVVMTREEREKLPMEAQNALSMAGMLYEDEPDEYARRARSPMSAHLTNTAPGSV